MSEEGETIKFYSRNDTEVYRNMDDYPIPFGIDDLSSIRIDIEEALHQFPFHEDKDINVNCKRLECDLEEQLSDAGICYVPACTFEEEEEEDPSQGEEDLSQGEEDTYDVEDGPFNFYYPSDVEEDPSKILDFLEPIRPVKRDMTAVFWDAEDCPFPLGYTPDEIYHSIASALVEREFTDNITIWAYLGDDDDKKGYSRDDLLGDKTWASRIYFLPAGDKDSRRIRMASDILFFCDSGLPESLILVTDQFKADLYYLELLYLLRLDIAFIYPTQDINQPESSEWPQLLIDEGHYHFPARSASEICYEPCPKNRKANAEAEWPAGLLEAKEETTESFQL